MKTFCLIVLMAATAGLAAYAQPGTNATPLSPRLIHIDSDGEVIDGNGRTVTHLGNVRVTDPDMKLTCTLLVADLPQSGGHPGRIVAETNVVIDATNSNHQSMHATGDKAVYIYNVQNGVTNETITLTGNPQPRVETAQATNTADIIVWDRVNNSYTFTGNQHLVGRENFSAPTDTKQQPAATNSLTSQKANLPPGADTNFPPGKLDAAPDHRSDAPPPQTLQPKLPN
jgi:lipopolysaccharide export system protein LptA